MIVTRLITDADKVAAKINTLAGRSVAVAHHSENKQSASAMAKYDVLVITHQAFMNAAEAFGAHEPDRWNVMHSWSGGTRSLIIVDEALANAVDHTQSTSTDLDVVLRAVPHALREPHSQAIRTLEKLKVFLDSKEKPQAPGSESAKMLWNAGSPTCATQIRQLREALCAVQFDPALYNEDALETVAGILEDVELMLDGYAYYYRNGAQHSLNSSRYLLPHGMPGIVILDATAHSNLLYSLLEGAVYIVPVPGGIRDYGNVTLHVARTVAGLGKTKMKETKHLRLPRLAKELAKEVGKGRKVFLCVHKLAKDLAATFSTEELTLKVGWWGAVDGSNDWAECDVAVIFGLPYMDPRRAINNVFAVSGPQDDAWLQSPPVYHRNANILDVMMQRDVSASVVQAINRIQCRRIIDTAGRCAKSDVYIVLPKDWRGDAISDDICTNMPGIRVVPWEFEPDGPKVYAARSGSAADAVLGLMRDRKPGPMSLPHIQRELSLTKRQVARLKEALPSPTSRLTTALRELGVIYKVEGKGCKAKSFLLKAA
jgi:Arc/MetJ family transcription regulator